MERWLITPMGLYRVMMMIDEPHKFLVERYEDYGEDPTFTYSTSSIERLGGFLKARGLSAPIGEFIGFLFGEETVH